RHDHPGAGRSREGRSDQGRRAAGRDDQAPHFVFQVRNQLTAILGGDEAAVTRGGYKVTTTLDMTKQQIAERQVRDWVEELHTKNVWNAALVSIDPRNGEVVAYVGSVDYNNRDDPRVQGQD